MIEEPHDLGKSRFDGDRTRPSLLLRVRDLGDQTSWDEFVVLYGPLILRFLRRIGVAQHDAPDLVQDVLVIVATHIGSFQYDPAKRFRAWLKTVARHRAYRFFTETGRRPITPGASSGVDVIGTAPDDDNGLDELIEEEWRRRRLEVAIERVRANPQMKDSTWRVFELQLNEGLSAPEIAERLDIKIGTVYTKLSRVLAMLRKAIEEIDE